jgi:hypothetical protein
MAVWRLNVAKTFGLLEILENVQKSKSRLDDERRRPPAEPAPILRCQRAVCDAVAMEARRE